jgi:hypothetical protein
MANPPEWTAELQARMEHLEPGARWFHPSGQQYVWDGAEWQEAPTDGDMECRWCGRIRPDHTENCPVRALATELARRAER